MKKLGAVALIVIVVVVLVWLHYEHSGQQTTSHNQTATTTGNNSPATIGNNNALIQNSPNATLNYGVSDETYKQMVDGMLAVQKQKDAELLKIFNLGYIIFTATERNEVIPSHSNWDDIIEIDWKSGYKVSFSNDDNTIALKLPRVNFHPSNLGSVVLMDSNTVITVHKRIEPFARPGFVWNNYRLAFKVVSINNDSVIIAMGIQSPPPPRPSMEELMKYGYVSTYFEHAVFTNRPRDSTPISENNLGN